LRITATGHAGLFIETAAGSVLCDPWRTPAYFASWFVFPDNTEFDFSGTRPDFLYVSHLHRDHFDAELLRRCIPRSTRVLLPEYPTDDLHDALEALGFHHFVQTSNGAPVELDGLRVMISAMSSPADGPLGDSALALDDGTFRLFNQNDARPRDFAPIQDFGHYDAHFLQFSGAIWWPVVYELAEATKQALGVRKRENGMARAMRFAETVGASWVFPNSGPAAFLDDDLFAYNDLDDAPENPFPDQAAFLRYLAEHGHSNGRLLIPGSSADLRQDGEPRISHAVGEAELQAIFEDKAAYLKAYAERKRPVIAAMRGAWPRYDGDLREALADWFESLLVLADRIGPGVGANVLLEISEEPVGAAASVSEPAGEDGAVDAAAAGGGAGGGGPAGEGAGGGGGGTREAIAIDFANRQVRRYEGDECRYRFVVERRLLEALVAEHQIDWVNSLFLSLRFRAARRGAYNEFVYTFFKCLAPERLSYAEGWYAEQEGPGDMVQIGDYMVQRRCPHLKADLGRFGELHPDNVLQCGMHGWRFDLETGHCLTSDDHPIICYKVGSEPPAAAGNLSPG
jgi:UDP-MurNAc hydroxylase